MITYISATELKNKVAEVLNKAYFGGDVTVIERFGKPIAKIVPVEEKRETKSNIAKSLKETFGSISEFPEVTKYRRSRKHFPVL